MFAQWRRGREKQTCMDLVFSKRWRVLWHQRLVDLECISSDDLSNSLTGNSDNNKLCVNKEKERERRRRRRIMWKQEKLTAGSVECYSACVPGGPVYETGWDESVGAQWVSYCSLLSVSEQLSELGFVLTYWLTILNSLVKLLFLELPQWS